MVVEVIHNLENFKIKLKSGGHSVVFKHLLFHFTFL